MEPWYNPEQLARTALRTILSTLFGSYADKREMQACLNSSDPYMGIVEKHKDEVWVDFVADLGSGFNSTYSLAYLLAKDQLHIAGHDTKRGNLLIMGGDEVYPTPSWDQYENRLIGPYRSAKSFIPEPYAPRLFAIPGNHDWYDGLTSFLKVFCQQRWMGAWKTEQTRSYFAIKLPHDWWLWGIDIQLAEDIDQPQQQFFERVNRMYTKNGDKVILCTAEPAWVYQAYKDRDKSFRNLEWFCEKYITDPDTSVYADAEEQPMKRLTLPVTLTGDMHHYSSYFSPPTDPDKPTLPPDEWKITAGGGGAFMHPTHHLPVQFKENENLLNGQRSPKEYQSSAFFPNQTKSRLLVLGNLLFLFKNPWFAFLMGGLCLLFTWMMVSAGSFNELAGCPLAWSSVCPVAHIYLRQLPIHPFLLVFILVIGGGFVAFTDTTHKHYRWASYAGGIFHGILQVLLLLTICWAFYIGTYTRWEQPLYQAIKLLLAGGTLGGMLMGLYLLTVNGLFGTHETEAFSSLRIQDYKNFLRLHLTQDQLTIYPVKIEHVPRTWEYQANMTNGEPWFEPDGNLHPGLIEPPIVISNR